MIVNGAITFVLFSCAFVEGELVGVLDSTTKNLENITTGSRNVVEAAPETRFENRKRRTPEEDFGSEEDGGECDDKKSGFGGLQGYFLLSKNPNEKSGESEGNSDREGKKPTKNNVAGDEPLSDGNGEIIVENKENKDSMEVSSSIIETFQLSNRPDPTPLGQTILRAQPRDEAGISWYLPHLERTGDVTEGRFNGDRIMPWEGEGDTRRLGVDSMEKGRLLRMALNRGPGWNKRNDDAALLFNPAQGWGRDTQHLPFLSTPFRQSDRRWKRDSSNDKSGKKEKGRDSVSEFFEGLTVGEKSRLPSFSLSNLGASNALGRSHSIAGFVGSESDPVEPGPSKRWVNPAPNLLTLWWERALKDPEPPRPTLLQKKRRRRANKRKHHNSYPVFLVNLKPSRNRDDESYWRRVNPDD